MDVLPEIALGISVKRTTELRPGDLVILPSRITRTVSHILPNGYLNILREPLFNVYYREGRTAEWSEGNSSSANRLWRVGNDLPIMEAESR